MPTVRSLRLEPASGLPDNAREAAIEAADASGGGCFPDPAPRSLERMGARPSARPTMSTAVRIWRRTSAGRRACALQAETRGEGVGATLPGRADVGGRNYHMGPRRDQANPT